jgi:hypothetical protein
MSSFVCKAQCFLLIRGYIEPKKLTSCCTSGDKLPIRKTVDSNLEMRRKQQGQNLTAARLCIFFIHSPAALCQTL